MYPAPFASYVLLERLGAGGMSEVDLARRSVSDAGFVRLVVIKRIKADRTTDSSFVNMFKDEARITAELSHENIGRVYDFGRQGDEWYLVLEYVAGIDLRQLISELAERRQRVPLRVGLGILVKVLEALDHAHRKKDALGKPMNVVHRDVNPRNVMVSVRGEVKLIDFGVAFAADRLERTRTDHVKGKFSYMAPEQISGDKVDHRADLYAVGLTLHELLTGHGPFSGLNQIQILHRMMSGEVPKFPAVPELADPAPLKAVHARALHKDRNLRWQSAAELRDALLDVLAPLGGPPSADEIADFLRRTSPETVARIEAKIESYSAGGVPAPGSLADEPSAGTFPGVPEGTLDRPGPAKPASRPRDDSASMSRVRPVGVVAGGVLVGVMLGAAILVLLSGVVAVVGWQILAPAEVEPARPEVVAVAPPPAEPAPEPPAPEPIAVAPAPVAPAPRPVDAPSPVAPAPEPVVAPPVEVVESPAPTPAPVVAPAETGTVQVTASERGRAISVDGAPTGRATPAEIRLSVGAHTVAVEGYSAQEVTVRRNQVHNLLFRP